MTTIKILVIISLSIFFNISFINKIPSINGIDILQVIFQKLYLASPSFRITILLRNFIISFIKIRIFVVIHKFFETLFIGKLNFNIIYIDISYFDVSFLTLCTDQSKTYIRKLNWVFVKDFSLYNFFHRFIIFFKDWGLICLWKIVPRSSSHTYSFFL